MGLDLSHAGLSDELKRAREHARKFVSETYREQIRRFYGPAWKDGGAMPTMTDFENHAYAWLSAFLPLLASGNPTTRGKTPRQGSAAAFAKAVEFAVNRNFALTDVKRTIEQLATDWAFKYCVGITVPMPVRGMAEHEDPQHRPTSKRLSLEDYLWDPLAPQQAECRYQAHRITRDKDSLLQEAEDSPERGWDAQQIAALHEDKAREQKRRDLDLDIRRNEVEFWEFWVPEYTLEKAKDANGKSFDPTPEDGFYGTVFTVTEDGSDFIRAPRPFFGPRDGAYTFSGYLYVPDETVSLSPIVATAAQAEILNAVMSAAVQSIRSYKKGIAVNSTAGGLEEKIASFLDLGVFVVDAVDKLDDHMRPVEVGGLTQQHLTMLEVLRFVLERASGLNEPQQGATTGATATESSIANMSTNRRLGYMTEKFIQSVVKPIARREAWYLVNHPLSRTPLGDAAEGLFVDPFTGRPIEYPVLEGGSGHAHLLEDLDIEIQPISMRYTSEMLEMERQASWEQFLLATAPMIPQLPYVDWGLVYSKKAESLGDISLAKTIDIEKAMFMGMLQFQMNLGMVGQPMARTAQPPQPRLGVDVGRPSLKASERPQGFTANARGAQAANGRARSSSRPQPKKGPREAGASASTR